MQIITLNNGFYLIGKVKDLPKKMEELTKKYYSIQQLIKSNLQ